MKSLIDRFILLLGCCFLMDIVSNMTITLICLLVAIGISEFQIIFDHQKVSIVLGSLYLVLCLIQPIFFIFLPLILYDILWHRIWWLFGLSLGLVAIELPQLSVFSRCYLVFWVLLAILIESYTKKANNDFAELIQLKDNSKELQMMLEGRNKELLMKQDNEIHLATLRERNRIAREIHDNVGHMISRSILMVGATIAVNEDPAIKDNLEALKETLSSAMTEIRSSVHDLHDESIDLKESLNQLVESFTFCPITLDYDMGKQQTRDLKVCFLSIIKEACSNIIKHSNATNVQILVREHPGIYQLLIQDNGEGKKQTDFQGMGLSNMKERVRALSGQITITSEHGFHIFVSIPK